LRFDPAQRLAELVPRQRRRNVIGRPAVAGKPRVLVALSGGLDSMALLTSLASARHQFAGLRACHVNHHISESANEWGSFCRRAARRLGVPLKVLHVRSRPPRGASIEEWARQQRYALLAEELGEREVLVTAQHLDDQAETVLLQLLRGAGVGGLAGMPGIMPFAAGWLARPMLQVQRGDLEEYARVHHLAWVEDDMNADEAFNRNFLRRRVMPLLKTRWPAAAMVIARSASHLAEARDLLDERAQTDLARIADGDRLLVSGLKALQPARRRNALRTWFAQRGVRVPDTKHLAEITGPLLDARVDAQPHVEWDDVRVARVAGRLQLVRREPAAAVAARSVHAAVRIVWHWRTSPSIATPFGVIAIERDPHGPIDLDALPAKLEIRATTRGERLRLSGTRPRQSVRALLQAARVPISQRAVLPRIWAGAKLMVLGDRWLDISILADSSSKSRGRITVKSHVVRDPI
jgi:tRNA(Ile)-lysidine synthase